MWRGRATSRRAASRCSGCQTFLGLFVTRVGDVGTLCQLTIVAGVAHVVAIQSNCGIGMSEIACYGLVVVHGSRKKLLTEEQIWVDGYQL